MKVTIALLCLAAVSHAAPRPQQPDAAYSYDAPAAPASYAFDWSVNAVDAAAQPVNYGHQEQRQGDAVQGSYFVLLPDNRLMRVNYVADASGFHPTYSFEQYGAQGQAVRGAGVQQPQQTYSAPQGK